MTSPAETHAEMEADRRDRELTSRLQRRHDALVALQQTAGLGWGDTEDWAEREAARHLDAALRLLERELTCRQLRTRVAELEQERGKLVRDAAWERGRHHSGGV